MPLIHILILDTVHAYTATQSIVDSPVKGSDFRRGRAGAFNMSPSSTGAAITVTKIIKDLSGKFDGIAVRVPVIAGSLADITFIAKRETTKEEVIEVLRNASQDPRWQGILKVTEDQLVSSDIIGEPCGAFVDLKFTKVVGGNLVKVFSWYDNEYGYTSLLVRHVSMLQKFL
jgi:glyceraldehyde 3-phosphate dehydrogenase